MLKWTQNQRLNLLGVESQARFQQAQKNPVLFDDAAQLQQALFDFIADFANWDNTTKPEYLETSRTLTQAAHETLGGLPATRPLVVDPFAGGGSIPLEALRVGADAFASDLNPVAVLLNKVVLEYIPKYGQSLADEVRKWGQQIKEQAEKELAEFYPKDPDGATPIAYFWARTIICEGPKCGALIPLIRSLWLAKRTKGSVALKLIPKPQEKRVIFEIIENVRNSDIQEGTIRKGTAICPCCGYTIPNSNVRAQLASRHGGAADAQLTAVAIKVTNQAKRTYRTPNATDITSIESAKRRLQQIVGNDSNDFSLIPDELIPSERPSPNARGLSAVSRIGMTTFSDLFAPRQLLWLIYLTNKISAEETQLSVPVATLLALAVGRQADQHTSVVTWLSTIEAVSHTFTRQAIQIAWDYVEPNPLSDSGGNWDGAIEWIAKVCEANSRSSLLPGVSQQFSATNHPISSDSVSAFITDPPYYDSVPYADLSDFFYVWLKRCLKQRQPGLFGTTLTPKDEEAIWNPSRIHSQTGIGKDIEFYEQQMTRALSEGRRITAPDGIGLVVFAHKSTAGWEAILNSLIQAGWVAIASWPIDTERGNRVNAIDTASLASSIHLICRPRERLDGLLQTDNIGDWRDVLQELPRRIHAWLPRLADEGVVGADAIFACLGPALEIFSRYSRVEKTNGDLVPLGEYLEAVWAAVSKEALAMVFAGADTSGFEEDARLTAMWLWTLSSGREELVTSKKSSTDDDNADEDDETFLDRAGRRGNKDKISKGGYYSLEYDAARKIAQGLGAHLEHLSTLIQVKGSEAHLLSVSDRTKYLFGKVAINEPEPRSRKPKQPTLFDASLDVKAADWGFQPNDDFQPGVTTLDRVHQSMLLFQSGRSDVLKRFLVDQGVGQNERFWRLAQAFSALYPLNSEEKRWVDGVLARKKGLGL
jgi:adenine-specific DNA methylase